MYSNKKIFLVTIFITNILILNIHLVMVTRARDFLTFIIPITYIFVMKLQKSPLRLKFLNINLKLLLT